MRYDMLWNLQDVVNSTECRRKEFLPHFEAKLPENYKCGACDVCVPSLAFPDIRNQPEGVASDEAMERLLMQQFANDPSSINLTILRQLAQEFKDYRVTKYRRAQGVLSGSPNNLSALYFLREFSPPDELVGNARRLLRTANEFRIGLKDVKDLYDSSPDRLKADMLVSVLNEVYGTCNNIEGWEFLAKEAAKPEHRHNKEVTMMGKCLEFFIITDRVLPQETNMLKRKTEELEAAFYA
jgi:hypothetical protein